MTEFVPHKHATVDRGPPGNRMYLVCASCPDTELALQLGKRQAVDEAYHRCPSAAEIRAFFEKHAKCPGGPDNFKLAFGKIPNWDYHEPELVTDAVKLALVKP